MIGFGGSPRASINLALAARSYAFIKRRGYVIPDKNEDDSPQGADQNSGECIVAKNRHGEARTVKMHWQGEFMRFTGTEDRSE